MSRHGVRHKVASPYHPQISDRVEVSNREIKLILKKLWQELERIERSNCLIHSRRTAQHTTLLSE
jgi:hypothetical protein